MHLKENKNSERCSKGRCLRTTNFHSGPLKYTSNCPDSHPCYERQADNTESQHQMESIYRLAEDNNMRFNPGEFQTLRYQCPKLNIKLTGYTSLQRITIPEPKSVPDLGIGMSDGTSFQVHISRMATKCRRLVDWILRTFKIRGKEMMIVLWKKFIIIQLDYFSQLLSPNSVKLRAELEAIQQRFTKKIDSLQQLSYCGRLKEIRLYSPK